MRLVISLCMLVAAAGVARAEGRVAVVNLRFVDVPDIERKAWRAAVERALEERGLQLISEMSVRLAAQNNRELFDCFAEYRCRTQIGRALQADLLLSGTVSREKDEWQANLALFAVDLGSVSKQLSVDCPNCSPQSVEQRLVETVGDLVNADKALQRGGLIIRTRPPGALLRIDQRPVGRAELEVTVVAGTHTVEASLEGYETVTTTVEVKTRERIDVDLKMPPRRSVHLDPKISGGPPRGWWTGMRIAGVTMAAVGVLGLILSAPLFAIHNTCQDEPDCIFKYDTASGGGALAGIGGALLITGGVVILTARPQVAVTPDSAGVAATFGF